MSDHPTDFQGDVIAAIRDGITAKIPDAKVEASGGGGHYSIKVVSRASASCSPRSSI
jgi:acid stress-induced BolA-like protein IbaG/YrbA